MKKTTKKYIYIFLFLFLFLQLFERVPVFAQTSSGKKLIRVGYTDKGFMIRKQNNEFVGYGVDYLDLLAEITDWEYEYIPVNESNRIESLKNHEIDLLCDVSEEEISPREVLLSSYKSSLHYALLCAAEEDTSIFYNEFSAINQKRVAINKSRHMERLMNEFAELHQISYTPVYCNSFSEMENAIAQGTADLMVVSNQRKLNGFKYVAKAGVRNQYFAVPADQKELLIQLNEADIQLKLARPFLISQLYEKWYGNPAISLIGETREEYDFIQKQTPVRVIYDADSFPVEYHDKKNNKFSGIYADALDLIQQKTGLNFQFIPIENYSEAWNMLKNGEADMSSGMYLPEELKEKYGLRSSVSHFKNSYTLILNTNTDLENAKTLVLPKEAIDIQAYVRENYPRLKIITANDTTSCLNIANAGKADGTLMHSIYLQTVYNFKKYQNLAVIPMHTVEIPVSFAFASKNSKLLLSIINKAIRTIPPSSFTNCIVENSVEVIYEPTKWEMLIKLSPVLIAILGLLAALYLFSLQAREKHYHYLAMTDSVTGLWNNICFREKAKEWLSRNPDTDFGIASLDIQHFHRVNADFGEKAGDLILRILAGRIKEFFAEDAMYAREMGDIYLILYPLDRDTDSFIDFLSDTIVFPMNGVTQQYSPDLKFGVCVIPSGQRLSLNEYIDRAHEARKSIKGNSSSTLAWFDEKMEDSLLHQLYIENKMKSALENEEFQVYYQPKYDLQTNKLSGAEALVRWFDPIDGLIFPDLFIPTFEKNGFIVQMDFYVYEKVLQTLSRWLKENRSPITISVNVSRIHIGTGTFLSRLIKLTDSYQIPHNLLELELTESTIGESPQDTIEFIHECRAAGFPVSIDDFGSGYSSLNLLKELTVDVLKLDREFLNETKTSQNAAIIIEQIIMMAERINIQTLCEGVETQAQASFLKDIGCNLAQGYFYSKPVPLDVFESLL